MTRPRIAVDARRSDDAIELTWTGPKASGRVRFERLPDTRPEWIAEAEALLDGADRRSAAAVLDAVASWASDEGLDVGVWHPDGSIEHLTD